MLWTSVKHEGWGPGPDFRELHNKAGRWGLNISSSLRTRLLSIFRMVVIQIILNLSKFTSRRNWAPTGLHYPQIVTSSMGYLRQNNNPFNDIEELQHHTLELWDKCAINLNFVESLLVVALKESDSIKVVRIVNIKLSLMEWFFYNLVILI